MTPGAGSFVIEFLAIAWPILLAIPIGTLLGAVVKLYASRRHPEAWKAYRQSTRAYAWWDAVTNTLTWSLLALLMPERWIPAVFVGVGCLNLVTLFYFQRVQFSLITLLWLTLGVALLGSVYRCFGSHGLMYLIFLSLPASLLLRPRTTNWLTKR